MDKIERCVFSVLFASHAIWNDGIARSPTVEYSKKENIQIGFQYYYYMWAIYDDAGLLLSIIVWVTRRANIKEEKKTRLLLTSTERETRMGPFRSRMWRQIHENQKKKTPIQPKLYIDKTFRWIFLFLITQPYPTWKTWIHYIRVNCIRQPQQLPRRQSTNLIYTCDVFR